MKRFNRFRRDLQEKQAEIRAAIRNRGDIAIENAPDEMDAVQLATLRDQALTELNRGARLLRDITAALARIEDGSYGVCDQCEEEIARKRLRAVPWARFCVRCQEAADREVSVDAHAA